MLRSSSLLICASILGIQTAPADDFCRTSAHADGVIDWSAAVPGPSGSFTVPVRGVPGLQATVTSATPGLGLPNILIDPNTINFIFGSVKLTFNIPIKAINVRLANEQIRGSYSFVLSAERTPPGSPTNYTTGQVSASSSGEVSLLQAATANLSLVSPATDITSVTFSPPSSFYPALIVKNLRIQSGDYDASSLVPRSGLQMWLANSFLLGPGSAFGHGTVSQWTDLSGHGTDATQTIAANQPTVHLTASDLHTEHPIGDGPTCKPSVHFGGNGQFMNFSLPINGLTEATIFLVAAADTDGTGGWSKSESAAIFWNESDLWGSTHLTPYQTNVSARFGTTQVNNDLSYTRTVDLGGDFTVTTLQKRGSTDSMWVNGTLVLRQLGKLGQLVGVRDDGFLGRGYNNTYWTGDIAEVLVYSRALSVSERLAVERYLTDKHFDVRR